MQRTLASAARCEGVGVHSGKRSAALFQPAKADAGIIFTRSDLAEKPAAQKELRAACQYLSGDKLSTELTNDHGVRLATVEHIMAALSGLGIDNARIAIDGPETPIMDGSAKEFVSACLRAGIAELPPPRKTLRILSPVRVREGDKYAEIVPARQFSVDITIDFADPAIGRQHYAAALSPDIFAKEIAPARTFGFADDLENLHKAGLARGASLENTIAIRDGAILNSEPLRFPDECVRHKALDAIGDLAMAGFPIQGAFRSFKGGHALNHALLRALLAKPDAWRIEREKSAEAAPSPAPSRPTAEIRQ